MGIRSVERHNPPNWREPLGCEFGARNHLDSGTLGFNQSRHGLWLFGRGISFGTLPHALSSFDLLRNDVVATPETGTTSLT